MMEKSRRDFLTTIFPKFIESVSANSKIVCIGHFTAFPVPSTKEIKIKDMDLYIESLPEGVRLRDTLTNRNFKLSISASGLLQAHLDEVWPSSAVLSIFSGEIYNI